MRSLLIPPLLFLGLPRGLGTASGGPAEQAVGRCGDKTEGACVPSRPGVLSSAAQAACCAPHHAEPALGSRLHRTDSSSKDLHPEPNKAGGAGGGGSRHGVTPVWGLTSRTRTAFGLQTSAKPPAPRDHREPSWQWDGAPGEPEPVPGRRREEWGGGASRPRGGLGFDSSGWPGEGGMLLINPQPRQTQLGRPWEWKGR